MTGISQKTGKEVS